MSSVRELETEMPTDGQPLAFTAQKPGEWVVATGQLDHYPPLQVAGRYVFLVAFGPGQAGTVSLRLAPPA